MGLERGQWARRDSAAQVSESEAKWWLSLLCSAVRCGGAALLPHRHELEIIMRATFLDEREAVNKVGMKLLRRILYAITAVYVSNDYRLCNDQVWQSLMGCRLGSATPPKPGLTTLVWSGAQPPWWFEDPDSAVQWHMPSDEEAWSHLSTFQGSGVRGLAFWNDFQAKNGRFNRTIYLSHPFPKPDQHAQVLTRSPLQEIWSLVSSWK